MVRLLVSSDSGSGDKGHSMAYFFNRLDKIRILTFKMSTLHTILTSRISRKFKRVREILQMYIIINMFYSVSLNSLETRRFVVTG